MIFLNPSVANICTIHCTFCDFVAHRWLHEYPATKESISRAHVMAPGYLIQFFYAIFMIFRNYYKYFDYYNVIGLLRN